MEEFHPVPGLCRDCESSLGDKSSSLQNLEEDSEPSEESLSETSGASVVVFSEYAIYDPSDESEGAFIVGSERLELEGQPLKLVQDEDAGRRRYLWSPEPGRYDNGKGSFAY